MCDNIELISRIKFISKIKQGDKINTKGFFIQNDSLLSKISRSFLYQDTRTNTINFISETLLQVFHLLKLYVSTEKLSDISMCINVIEDIINMKKGIINLQNTYQDDAIIVSKFETFVQEIDSKLLEFKNINADKIKTTPVDSIVFQTVPLEIYEKEIEKETKADCGQEITKSESKQEPYIKSKKSIDPKKQ
jgi:hypothetical protein